MNEARPTLHSPGDAEANRLAYLDLLKLALCDLVAEQTSSVVTEATGPVSYELSEAMIAERLERRDWPLRGMTMIGYDRLADLQHVPARQRIAEHVGPRTARPIKSSLERDLELRIEELERELAAVTASTRPRRWLRRRSG